MSAVGSLSASADAHKVTIETEVDKSWIEFLTQDPDIFGYSHCGYWMFGIEHDPKLGWLVFEHFESRYHNAHDVVDEHPEFEHIVAGWREGIELPKKWHRLDTSLALKAWCEGFKRAGTMWYENGDANTYDVAVQMALFGRVVYG